ncbi:MAG: hypothetical protein V1702_00500 [Candidatus Woesearchaeota archaeon]
MAKRQDNMFGIASLILGIVSIISILEVSFAVALGILAIASSLKQITKSPNGIATAGLITGIIGSMFALGVKLLNGLWFD